ncbi:hypothetical protein [Thermithiobacillus plumbiphilus]|uniref:Rhodanese domain-containing protein n=1 Tax=Thermithiobacillus plumbiphilus TaxID=1729899 RepID=A0ABU9D7K8_9PROT
MKMHLSRSRAGVAVLVMLLGLQGCGEDGGDKTADAVGSIKVSAVTDLPQESADNYDDNINGLITAATLKKWIDDWLVNRPAGITGKLVILQATAGETSYEYIKPNGVNVVTYLTSSGEWIQTRDNGVIETPSLVPDGQAMDVLLKKFAIDPSKDMIVVTMGTASPVNVMAQGRIWYALRYWGVAKEHLAILNGGHKWQFDSGALAASYFSTGGSTPPNNGTASVRDLKVDNTILQATFEDVINAAKSTDVNDPNDGVFIWDARNLGQYSSGEYVEKGEDTDTSTSGVQACATAYCASLRPEIYLPFFQNNNSKGGHPNGALQLQFTHFLDLTKGSSYRPKAELAALLNGDTNASGIGFVAGNYQLVGAGNAYRPGDVIYTYCETTFRAMITGFASMAILGKPVRFYDGAMVEWNSLSSTEDGSGNLILPADSPWRTDRTDRAFFRYAKDSIDPVTGIAVGSGVVAQRYITNPYAPHADKIIRADKRYKYGETIDTQGASPIVANPCG